MATSSFPVSSIPLFGRKWSIVVQTQSGDQIEYNVSDFDPNALRGSFDIQTYALTGLWTAKVTLWNLDQAQAQAAVNPGDEIQINAGYQNGDNYGLIWQGKIYQPIYNKVGGTDYTITFLCAAGIQDWYRNFCSTSYPGQTSQLQAIKQMISNSQSPDMPLVMSDDDSQTLSSLQKPRGGVAFGPISKYFNLTAQAQTNWVTSFDGTNTQIGQLGGGSSGTPEIAYAPFNPRQTSPTPGTTNSLIGTPQQTQLGVNFRVLLDSRLKCKIPSQLIGIDQSVIQQLPAQIIGSGPNGLPTVPFVLPINQSGQYFVAGVRHIGDTRSNEWYSDVTAISPQGILAAAGQQTS